jgi:hypothetical protein
VDLVASGNERNDEIGAGDRPTDDHRRQIDGYVVLTRRGHTLVQELTQHA